MPKNMFVNNPDQLISYRLVQSCDGKDKGCQYLEIENGVLSLGVDVDHAFDISYLRHKGMLISCLTGNGFNASLRDMSFGKFFPAGMLYTCGFDSISVQEGHVPHGSLHTTPSKLISVKRDDRGIEVVGETRFTELFGYDITLERHISLLCNSEEVHIHDFIKNEKSTDQKIVMLYHFNIGYPFYAPGTRIEMKSITREGVTPYAEERKDDFAYVDEKILPEEVVIYHSGNDGVVNVISSNARKTLELRYDTENLPYLVEWKSQVEKNYCLGIEPASSRFMKNLAYTTLKGDGVMENDFVIKVTDNA